ncbi:MAG: hypothetical protein R3F62_08680 [Planctomycetota bacterium]
MADAHLERPLPIQVRPRPDEAEEPLRSPSEATLHALGPAVQIQFDGPRCPFCHEAVLANEHEQLACNRCRAWHHQACWSEAGGRCSACGAGSTGLQTARPRAPSASAPRRTRASRPARAPGLPRLPAWLLGLGCCLVLVSLLVTLVLLQVDVLQSLSAFGYFLGALLSGSASLWIALVTVYSSWPDPDDPKHLGLLGYEGPRSTRARETIVQRFAQSREAARATGLSLVNPAGVDLLDARIVCAERLVNPRDLLTVLIPLSADAFAPPLVLVAGEVSDEVLELFQVNAENAVLPGCVLRATPNELSQVARIAKARLVRAGQRVRCRDVGAARVRIDARVVDFVSREGIYPVAFRPR